MGVFFAVEKDRIEAEIDKNFQEWLKEVGGLVIVILEDCSI